MARNTPLFLEDRFMAISGIGKRQSGLDDLFDNADLDFRLKADVKLNLVDERRTILDCDGVDIDDEILQRSRMLVTLTFPNGVQPSLMAIFLAYYLGAAAAPTGILANEEQTLTRTGTVSGGSFSLSIDFEGRQGATGAIPFNASLAEIQAALTKEGSSIGKIIKPGDVSVSGDWASGFLFAFGGRLQNADLPLMTVDDTNLTGGGTVVNTAIADGSAYIHDLTRSSSREKIKFNFALGDKTGAVATDKYYNAVVDSYAPVISFGDDVGLTVGILCNSRPSREDAFIVPPCVNRPPLEAKDCRIKIGPDWQTLDIFSQNINLNDQILTGKEAYGFDSEQMESLLRGRNPQYQMPTQIFASSNDAIAALINTKVPVETHFGLPGNRLSILAGNALLKPQADAFPYVGELGRSAVALDITPHRDGADVPVKAQFRGSKAEAFLTI